MPTGPELPSFSHLGGVGNDFGCGIAVDSSGSAFVTGVAASANFLGGGTTDAFIAKIGESNPVPKLSSLPPSSGLLYRRGPDCAGDTRWLLGQALSGRWEGYETACSA